MNFVIRFIYAAFIGDTLWSPFNPLSLELPLFCCMSLELRRRPVHIKSPGSGVVPPLLKFGMLIDAVFEVVLLKGMNALFGYDGYWTIPLLPFIIELNEI